MSQTRPTLLLTRPKPQSDTLARALADRLAPCPPVVVISPVMTIRHRDHPVDLDGIAGIVATSANGIAALIANAAPSGLPAFCVGKTTADAARQAGMLAQAADGTGADLIQRLRRIAPAGPLLYVRGAEMRVDVAKALKGDDFDIRNIVLYDQVPVALTDTARKILMQDAPVIAPLYSPNSAGRLGEAAKNALAPLHLVALSSAVADAWTGPIPKTLTISPQQGGEAMLRTICNTCARLTA